MMRCLILMLVFVEITQCITIYGWGKNDFGQLGLGNFNGPVLVITPIPFYASLPISNISAGENTHFASTSTNTYSCGSGSDGQLGIGPVPLTATPTPMPDIQGYYVVYALPKVTIAYSPAQKTMYGSGFAAGYVRGLSGGKYYRMQQIIPDFDFIGKIENVYTANGACFVLLTNGSIFTAGVSTAGVYGLGRNDSVPIFQEMSFWKQQQVNFLKIFPTQATTVFAQSVNRTVFCWGGNSAGQLGLGGHMKYNVSYTPMRLPFFDDNSLIVSQIKQGISHTIALTCGGRVYTWGSNQRGQLGIGTSDSDPHSTPIELTALRNSSVVEVVSGAYHNFARTANNTWYFWGMGEFGVSGGCAGTGANTGDILEPSMCPQYTSLGINHVESGAYSMFAFGWEAADVPIVPPDCPNGWNADECQDFPCGANMNCFNTERAYTCACKTGYQSDGSPNACKDINECLKFPCIAEGNCNNTDGSFICNCPPGYVGDGTIGGIGCSPIVCGNGKIEPGEECDALLSPSCCNATCFLEQEGVVCRNSTVICDKPEYCNGTSGFCPVDDWILGEFCDYCGNGQCNNKTETCSNCPIDCGSCDSCTSILCKGRCVLSPYDCMVHCSSSQFACASELCVDDFTSCATNNCSSNMVECWDGSCTNSLSRCPLIPACPMLTKRCYGRCLAGTQDCDTQEENCAPLKTCLDGKCAEKCPEYNGCPTGLIRCPNGQCTKNFTECKGNCVGDTYLCSDGSCNVPENCSALLQFEAAIPFSQRISPNAGGEIGVVSQSGIPIVSLQLFPDTFKNSTPVSVSPVSFSSMQEIPKPASWGNSTNIFSAAVAFDLPGTTKLGKPINVAFIGTLRSDQNISDLCLGYINSSNLWDCASDLIYENGTFLGNTSHFTPFAVIKQIHAPVINKLNGGQIDVFLKLSGKSVIIYVYCGLVILFSVLFVWAYNADRRARKKRKARKSVRTVGAYEYEEEPTKSRKPVSPPVSRPSTPAIIMASPAPSPALSSAPLMSSPSPTSPTYSPSPFPPPTPVSPSPLPPYSPSSPFPFPSSPSPSSPSPSGSQDLNGAFSFKDGQLNVEIGQEQNARPAGRSRRRTLVMKDVAQERFTTKHKWLSIYFSARVQNLPRVARVTILLSMILTNMTVAALFYNTENRSSTGQRIVVGIISSVIAFVCSFSIFTMFKLTQKKYRPICYAVSAIWILGTGFITLWLNLELEQDEAYGWCASASIGIIQDAILNEPLKIVLIAFLLAFFPFLPFIHKL